MNQIILKIIIYFLVKLMLSLSHSLLMETHHSLSIRMVPARLERTATAPDKLVKMTSTAKSRKLVDFKPWHISSEDTVPPANMKERFCVNNHV